MKDQSAAEDRMLLHQLREGNKNALDALYRKHWKFVYNAAYKRLQHEDQAKDIAQDVFIQFWTQQSFAVLLRILIISQPISMWPYATMY